MLFLRSSHTDKSKNEISTSFVVKKGSMAAFWGPLVACYAKERANESPLPEELCAQI